MNKQKQFYISKGSQKSKNSKLKCSLKTTLQEGINPTRRIRILQEDLLDFYFKRKMKKNFAV